MTLSLPKSHPGHVPVRAKVSTCVMVAESLPFTPDWANVWLNTPSSTPEIPEVVVFQKQSFRLEDPALYPTNPAFTLLELVLTLPVL